jgi:hypothetical protein
MPVCGIRGSTTVISNSEGEFVEVTNGFRAVLPLLANTDSSRAPILLHVNTEKGPHDDDYPLNHGASALRISSAGSTSL